MLPDQIINRAYWGVIESFEWSKDKDYKRIRKEFRKAELTGGQKQNITDFYRERLKELDGRVDLKALSEVASGDFWISDDGWWDLRADIIGQGEEAFRRVVNNPESLIKVIQERDYKENFGYAFSDFWQQKRYIH